MDTFQNHFSKIAPRYRELRTPDSAPVEFIANCLRDRPRLLAADVGCGAGRYTLKLLEFLGQRLFRYCLDANRRMLDQLKELLNSGGFDGFETHQSVAERLPLAGNTLDFVTTFNAVHHFDLIGFLEETARSLKTQGYLFIYTRLRHQNVKNIWGQYFPSFYEKETRLYETEMIKEAVAIT